MHSIQPRGTQQCQGEPLFAPRPIGFPDPFEAPGGAERECCRVYDRQGQFRGDEWYSHVPQESCLPLRAGNGDRVGEWGRGRWNQRSRL